MKIYKPLMRGGVGGYREYIYIRDRKDLGVQSGTFTSGAWRTRDLTQILEDETGLVALTANQFVLPAGKYEIFSTAPAFKCGPHTSRLQNITDAVTTLTGTSEHTSVTDNPNTRSFVFSTFEISVSTTFELQHRCTTTSSNNGFGIEVSLQDEVYTTVQLWRIKA